MPPLNFELEIKECPACGCKVKSNWLDRHVKSSCKQGKFDFWDCVKVGEEDECWLWIGASTDYGTFYKDKRNYPAHRYSFLEFYGRLDDNKLILHKCGNKLCVNPKHLYEGNHKDNSQDAFMDGTLLSRVGIQIGKKEVGEIARSFLFDGIEPDVLSNQYAISLQSVHRIIVEFIKQDNSIIVTSDC